MSSYSSETRDTQIAKLREEIESADAIVIGAGAGLSTSAGFTYKTFAFFKLNYKSRKRTSFDFITHKNASFCCFQLDFIILHKRLQEFPVTKKIRRKSADFFIIQLQES